MAKDLIYKVNGAFQYSGDIEPYFVESFSEIQGIPESQNAQAAIILKDGRIDDVIVKLPDGEWPEV